MLFGGFSSSRIFYRRIFGQRLFFGEFGGSGGSRVTSFAMDWRFTNRKSKQDVFSQSSGVTTNSGPLAKAAKHGHRAPLAAIEQF